MARAVGAHILVERPGWRWGRVGAPAPADAPAPTRQPPPPLPPTGSFRVLLAPIVTDPASQVDMAGMGDAFFGAFVAGAMRGFPSTTCMRWATAAADLTSFKVGAQASPTVAELEFYLRCEPVEVQEATVDSR